MKKFFIIFKNRKKFFDKNENYPQDDAASEKSIKNKCFDTDCVNFCGFIDSLYDCTMISKGGGIFSDHLEREISDLGNR